METRPSEIPGSKSGWMKTSTTTSGRSHTESEGVRGVARCSENDASPTRGATIFVRMRSRLLRRRAVTAGGIYLGTILGVGMTVVAARELGTDDFAKFAAVFAATGFFQLLHDLTIEEALVKYGFRYVESASWGRLRRLFELALAYKVVGGAVAGVALI